MNHTELLPENECFGLVIKVYDQDTVEKVINISLIVLNVLLSLCAIIENSILIRTIWKTTSLHRPSYVLLGCLGFADLLTGLLSQPSAIAYGIAKHYENWIATCNATTFFICSLVILSGVSVATLTAISIDRFLGLYFHLRYEEIVTVPRVLTLFAAFWPLNSIVLIPRIFNEVKLFTIFLSIGITLSAITILVCYWKIYTITKKHQSQIQDLERAMQHANGLTNDQIKTANKFSFSFFIVTVIFLCFAIPYLVACILLLVVGYRGFVVQFGDISMTIIMMNSAINPLVYCWRLRELRDAVKRQVNWFFQYWKGSENLGS